MYDVLVAGAPRWAQAVGKIEGRGLARQVCLALGWGMSGRACGPCQKGKSPPNKKKRGDA